MLEECYRIMVEGCLDTDWSQWFSDWSLSHPDANTTLFQSGPIDQTALHGAIQKIRDLNLPIIFVNRTEGHTDANPSVK